MPFTKTARSNRPAGDIQNEVARQRVSGTALQRHGRDPSTAPYLCRTMFEPYRVAYSRTQQACRGVHGDTTRREEGPREPSAAHHP